MGLLQALPGPCAGLAGAGCSGGRGGLGRGMRVASAGGIGGFRGRLWRPGGGRRGRGAGGRIRAVLGWGSGRRRTCLLVSVACVALSRCVRCTAEVGGISRLGLGWKRSAEMGSDWVTDTQVSKLGPGRQVEWGGCLKVPREKQNLKG